MIILELQIRASGFRFAKEKLRPDQLSPSIGKFIDDLHQIDASNVMVRPDLALDTPNFCRYSGFRLKC